MIEFKHVSFSYDLNMEQEDTQEIDNLHDINLTVNDGECVLLCGKSGCGKSTLTRLVNGLIPHFYPGKLTGEVLLDGRDISKMPMYETASLVGSVFQKSLLEWKIWRYQVNRLKKKLRLPQRIWRLKIYGEEIFSLFQEEKSRRLLLPPYMP